jgi:hypothetical protein
MRNYSTNSLLLTICLLFLAPSIALARTDEKAVIVPADVYPIFILSQPDCSLKIEAASLLRQLDGTFMEVYRIRNIGRKPIRSYTIAIWNSDNTGHEITWHINPDEGALRPGKTHSRFPNDAKSRFVPLNDELRQRLGLVPPPKKLVFFFIVCVENVDGTSEDYRHIFASLKNHLSQFIKVYERMPR